MNKFATPEAALKALWKLRRAKEQEEAIADRALGRVKAIQEDDKEIMDQLRPVFAAGERRRFMFEDGTGGQQAEVTRYESSGLLVVFYATEPASLLTWPEAEAAPTDLADGLVGALGDSVVVFDEPDGSASVEVGAGEFPQPADKPEAPAVQADRPARRTEDAPILSMMAASWNPSDAAGAATAIDEETA